MTRDGQGSWVGGRGRGVSQARVVGVLESMRRRGFNARGELGSCKSAPAPAWVAEELRVVAGTLLGCLTVRRRCDGVPFAIGTTWGPVALCEAIAREDLVFQDVSTIIAGQLGIRNARTRVRVLAENANATMARRLQCPKGTALLVIRTTSVDFDGQPTACSITHGRPDMMDYRVTLRG